MGTQTRVHAGRTVLKYNGQPVALCQSATFTEAATTATAVSEIGSDCPVEIVVDGAYTGGTIDLSFNETWESLFFEKFGFTTNSMREVLNRDDSNVTVEEIVTDEMGEVIRTNVYQKCRIINGPGARTVTPSKGVGTYQIGLQYCYMTSQ